jgi:hypothetical protein
VINHQTFKLLVRDDRYNADVLGEEQWRWLESVLDGTAHESEGGGFNRPDLTVVVSSVQVTTSNPLVESWGHFPKARSRCALRDPPLLPTGAVPTACHFLCHLLTEQPPLSSSSSSSSSSRHNQTAASTPATNSLTALTTPTTTAVTPPNPCHTHTHTQHHFHTHPLNNSPTCFQLSMQAVRPFVQAPPQRIVADIG